MEEDEETGPVTVFALAKHRLNRDPVNGDDFEQAGLPMLGGCIVCEASVAAYNSCPSKSGFIKCKTGCIDEDGYATVEEACEALFPEN